jgi:UDP-4-amino-4-deoxy-L-arabinose-oxoglutarate aminotransferase
MTLREYLPFGKPNFSDREIAAVTRVLRAGWVGMGPETVAFERELADYVGAPHVVTVNSCTSALFLSLLVSGVGPGDEVICPSLTWCSTANAALHLGAQPVFCDVDADTLCPSVEDVLAKVTSKTKALTVVHFGGLAADVAALRAALPAGVVVVEDAAHALGARFADGRRVGSSGNLTCFSFYANKNVSTGEGGAVALFDASLAERLRSLRQHEVPVNAWTRFTHSQRLLRSAPLDRLGYKMNYTDLQACIGRVQLARQPEFDAIRLDVARRYVDGLKGLAPPLAFQTDCAHPYHARHLFVIRLPLTHLRLSRDDVVLALRAKNIGASIHYAPLHLMPLYCGDQQPVSLPTTEQVAGQLVTLPIGASMTPGDAEDALRELIAVLTER